MEEGNQEVKDSIIEELSISESMNFTLGQKTVCSRLTIKKPIITASPRPFWIIRNITYGICDKK